MCPTYIQRLNQCMFRDCCKLLSHNVSTELALVSGVQDCDRAEWPMPQERVEVTATWPPPAITPAPPLAPPLLPKTLPEPCIPGRCVEFVISLPITEDKFTLVYQNTFRKAIANVANVELSAVQITTIQAVNDLRRRKLLTKDIRIGVVVKTNDQETAVLVSERLTQERINQELEAVGLPKGLLVQKPQVTLPLEAKSGGEGNKTLLIVIVVVAIAGSIIAGAIIGYCWRQRKMQEMAGIDDGFDLVGGSPAKHLESKSIDAELSNETGGKPSEAGVWGAGAAKAAGGGSNGAEQADAQAGGGYPGNGWGSKGASEPVMVDEDGFDSARTHAHPYTNTHTDSTAGCFCRRCHRPTGFHIVRVVADYLLFPWCLRGYAQVCRSCLARRVAKCPRRGGEAEQLHSLCKRTAPKIQKWSKCAARERLNSESEQRSDV